jgi:tetratricopeptide (TPR) repeat protein
VAEGTKVAGIPLTPAVRSEEKNPKSARACYREYFIRSVYIYTDKIVAFLYGGTPAGNGMTWAVIPLIGTLNRAYPIIPEAPALTGISPAAYINTVMLPRTGWQGLTQTVTQTGVPVTLQANVGTPPPERQPVSESPTTSIPSVGVSEKKAGETMTISPAPTNSAVFPALTTPILSSISPNPDYDGDVYLTWEEVPGATAYRIYRDFMPMAEVKNLRPLATTSDWYYTDTSPKEKRLYFYTVVALKASATSPNINISATQTNAGLIYDRIEESSPARCKSVFIDYQPASLSFWDDFDTNSLRESPAGWTTNNSAGSAMWFVTHASWALPSIQLILSDNQEGGNIWGYTDFTSAVSEGWLEFEIRLDKQVQDTAATEQNYFLHLRTEGGKDKVITLQIQSNMAKHQFNFVLQEVSGKTWFNENQAYQVVLAFGNDKLSLLVDGALEIGEIPFTPKPVKRLTIETTTNTNNGGCLFDNFALWNNTKIKKEAGVHASLPHGKTRKDLFKEYRITYEETKAEAFNQLAFQVYRRNNYQEAIQLFACAIEKDYDYTRGYYNLACMFNLLNEQSKDMNKEDLLRYLEKAYQSDPEFVLRAEKDQDLSAIKNWKEVQLLNEKYYYSFNSADLTFFTEGFARNVSAHRWQDLLKYFDKSYLLEYHDRFYTRKTDLFFCDFFELSNLLPFKAKKELSSFLLNQIKTCEVVKVTNEVVTFRLVIANETDAVQEIGINLKKIKEGNKGKFSFYRYFPARS